MKRSPIEQVSVSHKFVPMSRPQSVETVSVLMRIMSMQIIGEYLVFQTVVYFQEMGPVFLVVQSREAHVSF